MVGWTTLLLKMLKYCCNFRQKNKQTYGKSGKYQDRCMETRIDGQLARQLVHGQVTG
jgi:hypothetical protein